MNKGGEGKPEEEIRSRITIKIGNGGWGDGGSTTKSAKGGPRGWLAPAPRSFLRPGLAGDRLELVFSVAPRAEGSRIRIEYRLPIWIIGRR